MYQNIYTFPVDSTEAQGILSLSGAIKFSQVFGGKNLFYSGSTFQIEEIVTIISNIDDFSLLREENRWFQPKQYIGTWQRINEVGQVMGNNNDYGLIRSRVHKLTHTSLYTITSNPDKILQKNNGGHIRQCNFALVPDVGLKVPGNFGIPAILPYDDGIQFVYEDFLKPCDIEDKDYTPWFAGLGLYFYDGMSGNRVEFQASVINGIYNGNDPYTIDSCPLGKQTCDEAFTQYVFNNNQGHPIDAVYDGYYLSGLFSSLSGCNASGGAPCGPVVWVCPDGSGTRTYFIHINN